MPTIQQLPAATAVTGSDLLPLSQNGLTRSVAVSTLLNSTQPVLSLGQNTLLGRISAGLGGPEAIGIGTGLVLQSGAVAATAQDHLSLPIATSLLSTDEVVVNSNSTPKRLLASQLRLLFSAGSGVTIDANGVISSTSGGTGGSGTQGPAGPQGPVGQGFTFRGSWQANTAYSAYDVLVYSGQTFLSTTSYVSGSTFDLSHFALLAAQGSTGSAGPQGAAGAQGPAGPITPATSTSIGAVKPGAGLALAADGTISVANVSLATLAQSGATTGQLLGWTGTAWGPTTASGGGVSTFNSRTGVVSLTLSDVTTVIGTGAGARSSLGLATVAATGAYSDLTGSPSIPTASTQVPAMDGAANPGVATTFARSDHVHPSDTSRLSAGNNLSDLTNTSAARANLGLGGAATLNVGTASGTVAAGNDSRLIGALQASAIPAASGQLLGGSGTGGLSTAVTLGAGLSLSGGTLTATGGGGSYTLPTATTTTLGGVKPDGTTITISGGVISANTSGGGATLAVAGTDPAPTMAGTAAVGSSGKAAREDHVHPTDTTRLGASAIPAAANQLLGGSGAAGQAAAITLGTNLSLNGTTLNAAGGGSLPSGTANQLLYYAAAGSTPSALSLSSDFTVTSGTLNINSVSLHAFPAGAGLASGDEVGFWSLAANSGAGGDVKYNMGAIASFTRAVPVATLSTSGATVALTFAASGNNAYDVTLSANCTATLTGGVVGQLQILTLVVRGGSGGFTFTFPSGIKWPGGTVPTPDTSAGSYNEYYLRTIDGGSTYSGNY